jgi:SAM-dependent methyltransferase
VRKDLPGPLSVGGDIVPTEASDIVFDAASMPVADASVDVVLALEVLEHMSHPQRLLDESARVLRPGGRLIVTVPFMFGIHDYRDYYRYTPLGLEVMLGQSGMSLVEVKPRGGTFVASTGLLRNLILNAIVGNPKDWRAVGASKKVRWLVATAVLTPWTAVTWVAFALDAVFDRRTVSPPGFFFLCARDVTAVPLPLTDV